MLWSIAPQRHLPQAAQKIVPPIVLFIPQIIPIAAQIIPLSLDFVLIVPQIIPQIIPPSPSFSVGDFRMRNFAPVISTTLVAGVFFYY